MTQDEKLDQIYTNVSSFNHQITTIREDNHQLRNEVRESIRDLADAVKKLVAVEERQSYLIRENLDIKANVLTVEKRVDEIEKEIPGFRQTKTWVFYAVGLAAMAAVGVIFKAVGLPLLTG